MDKEVLEAILGGFSKILEEVTEIKKVLAESEVKRDKSIEEQNIKLDKFIEESNARRSQINEKFTNIGPTMRSFNPSYAENEPLKGIYSSYMKPKESIRKDLCERIEKVKPNEIKYEMKNEMKNVSAEPLATPAKSSIKNENPVKTIPKSQPLASNNNLNKPKVTYKNKQFDPEFGHKEEIFLTQQSQNLKPSDPSFSDFKLSQRKAIKISNFSQIHDPLKNSDGETGFGFFSVLEKEVEEAL